MSYTIEVEHVREEEFNITVSLDSGEMYIVGGNVYPWHNIVNEVLHTSAESQEDLDMVNNDIPYYLFFKTLDVCQDTTGNIVSDAELFAGFNLTELLYTHPEFNKNRKWALVTFPGRTHDTLTYDRFKKINEYYHSGAYPKFMVAEDSDVHVQIIEENGSSNEFLSKMLSVTETLDPPRTITKYDQVLCLPLAFRNEDVEYLKSLYGKLWWEVK